MIKFLIFIISLLLIYLASSGLKNGEVYISGFKRLSKYDAPVIFWVHIVLYLTIGIIGFISLLFPEQIASIF